MCRRSFYLAVKCKSVNIDLPPVCHGETHEKGDDCSAPGAVTEQSVIVGFGP